MKSFTLIDRVVLLAYSLLAAVGLTVCAESVFAGTSGAPCRLVRVVEMVETEVNGVTQTVETFVRFECKQFGPCDTEASCGVSNWPPTGVPNATGDILCWCPFEATNSSYWCDLPDYSWINDGEGNWSLQKEYGEDHTIEPLGPGNPAVQLECSLCSATAMCGEPVREEVEENLAAGGTRTVVHIYCPGCQ